MRKFSLRTENGSDMKMGSGYDTKKRVSETRQEKINEH